MIIMYNHIQQSFLASLTGIQYRPTPIQVCVTKYTTQLLWLLLTTVVRLVHNN